MSLTPQTDTAAQASIIASVFSDAPAAPSPASTPAAAQAQDAGPADGQPADIYSEAGGQVGSEGAETPAPAAQAVQAAVPPGETQIPLSAILALMQAGALPGAVPPQAPQPPAPPPKLKEQVALDAFYDAATRAEVVKHVLGGHYQPKTERSVGSENDPTALATVEAFLTSQVRNATIEAKLAAFETAQAQSQARMQQAQLQNYATNLFQAELAKFDTPNAVMVDTLADLVYSYQLQGKTVDQATALAFERGKQLGLRLKGAPGRPSNQQRQVSGRDTAQRVVAAPTGTATQAPAQQTPRTIRDVLKAVF